MDEFKFITTKTGRSFLWITGPTKSLLIDVDDIGRIWGLDGTTSIAIKSGSCEVAQLEAGKLIEGFLAFLDEA